MALQLYRDTTAIGGVVHTEASAASENSPFALTVIDSPSAGTYNYNLKAISELDGVIVALVISQSPIVIDRTIDNLA